jgi:hypothetical protein
MGRGLDSAASRQDPVAAIRGARLLLEKLIVAQLFKKFSAYYGSRRFITVFTKARHWSKLKQEVLERTNLPTFLTLFKNVVCIKTSVCHNITLVVNSVPMLKHFHIQNNVSNKSIVGSS